ncbi:MAG: FecR domain-containing protein [Desulfosudaceae bacterium]
MMKNNPSLKQLFFSWGVIWATVLAAGLVGPVEARTIGVEVGSGQAEITLLDGNAHLVDRDMKVVRSLSLADTVAEGSRVKVADKSRIELRLPDESYIRFDAGAVFELTGLSADKKAGKRDIDVNMVMGNIWATVSRLFSKKERFDVSTKTSVAGIRGTKYRLKVNPDQSAVVKVYEGALEVKSASEKTAEEGDGAITGLFRPHPVSGPHAVPGPHPVSMEEWVYIVSAMQQLVINSDGTAEKPFRFSYEEDLNDWVRWNRERDAAVGQPAEPPAELQGETPADAPAETPDASPDEESGWSEDISAS